MKKYLSSKKLIAVIISCLLTSVGFAQESANDSNNSDPSQDQHSGLPLTDQTIGLDNPAPQPNPSTNCLSGPLPTSSPTDSPAPPPIGSLTGGPTDNPAPQPIPDLSSAKVVTLEHLLDSCKPGSPGSGDQWKSPIEITLKRGQDLVIRVEKVNSVALASYYSWSPRPEKYAELLIQSRDYWSDPLELATDISKLGTHLPSDPDLGYIPNFAGETVELYWKNHFTGRLFHDLNWQFSYCFKGKSGPNKSFSRTSVNVQPVHIHLE